MEHLLTHITGLDMALCLALLLLYVWCNPKHNRCAEGLDTKAAD